MPIEAQPEIAPSDVELDHKLRNSQVVVPEVEDIIMESNNCFFNPQQKDVVKSSEMSREINPIPTLQMETPVFPPMS